MAIQFDHHKIFGLVLQIVIDNICILVESHHRKSRFLYNLWSFHQFFFLRHNPIKFQNQLRKWWEKQGRVLFFLEMKHPFNDEFYPIKICVRNKCPHQVKIKIIGPSPILQLPIEHLNNNLVENTHIKPNLTDMEINQAKLTTNKLRNRLNKRNPITIGWYRSN